MKITVAVAGDEVPNSSDWNNLSSMRTSHLPEAPEAGHSNYGYPCRILPHAGPHKGVQLRRRRQSCQLVNASAPITGAAVSPGQVSTLDRLGASVRPPG